MSEIFLSLNEVAELEGINYETVKKQIQRNKERYIVKIDKKEEGGRENVFVALSSLSPKAKKLYKRRNPSKNQLVLVEQTDVAPWYVSVSFSWFQSNYADQYTKALHVAKEVQAFLDYNEEDRTEFATEFAAEMGISARTLYRYAENCFCQSKKGPYF